MLSVWQALPWLVAVLCTALALHAAAPLASWRLRALRGPRPWPLLGNLPQMARRGRTAAFEAWAVEYGPMFKVRGVDVT